MSFGRKYWESTMVVNFLLLTLVKPVRVRHAAVRKTRDTISTYSRQACNCSVSRPKVQWPSQSVGLHIVTMLVRETESKRSFQMVCLQSVQIMDKPVRETVNRPKFSSHAA